MKQNAAVFIILFVIASSLTNGQDPFTCPVDQSEECLDGLYGDPRLCENYYNCSSCTAMELSCPQGEHFNPHLGLCTSPQNARCDGQFVTGSLFCVTRESPEDGPQEAVRYPNVLVNSINPYDTLSGTVLTPALGTYFFHLSAGLGPGESLDYRINGLPVSAAVYSDNRAHSVDVQVRDVMATLTQSTTLAVSLETGTATFSDASGLTSWSGFRLEEFMTETIAFSAETYSNASAGRAIVFHSVVVASGSSYNPSTGLFTAPADGRYLLTFTGGVASDGLLRCHFQSSTRGSLSIVLRSPRSESLSLTDTIGKSVIVELSAGEAVSMYVSAGEAVSVSPQVSLSFSGFLYAPQGGVGEAWAVYRTTPSDPVDPVGFDVISINDFSMYDPETDRVRITTSGRYFISLTGGTSVNTPLDLVLYVTDVDGFDSQLMAIYRSDDIGVYFDTDTIGRTIIASLSAGESLRAVLRAPGQLYSSQDKLVSFCGFLLQASDQ